MALGGGEGWHAPKGRKLKQAYEKSVTGPPCGRRSDINLEKIKIYNNFTRRPHESSIALRTFFAIEMCEFSFL